MIDSNQAEDVVMQVNKASKRFSHLPEKARRPGAREIFLAMIGQRNEEDMRKLRTDEFWAVRNVTFDLHRGEAMGIVGLNGAGKSTLLKMMLGRLSPDEGTIRVHGKAGGLIELGAGFHPELSGRRNIYVNASMLGVTEDHVEDQIEEIISFADIGRFIDSPVKTYSSGMKVRLGFSVAVHFVPDVVICDEVLAVGDFEFRQKCLQRIKNIRQTRSVVLVSHSARDIALFCNRALLLHHGEAIMIDEPERILKAFAVCSNHISPDEVRRRVEKLTTPTRRTLACSNVNKSQNSIGVPTSLSDSSTGKSQARRIAAFTNPKTGPMRTFATPSPLPDDNESLTKILGPQYWNREFIDDVALSWNLQQGEKGYFLFSGEPLYVHLSFTLRLRTESFRVGFPIFDDNGVMILGPDSRHSEDAQKISSPAHYQLTMSLDPLPLNSGHFRAVISICDDPAILFRRHLPDFQVFNPTQEFGVAKTFSVWTSGEPTEIQMKKVLAP